MVEQDKNPQTNPVPVQTQSQPTNSGGKKSNVGLIIALVLIGILLILGVGGYFTYRYIKNRVKTAVSNLEDSSSESNDSSAISTASSYSDAKDLTPTDPLMVATNNDLKPILEKIYGGAKLESWTILTADYGYATYVLKRDSNNTDASAVETALIAKGYKKQSNSQDESGSLSILTKGNDTLTIQVNNSSVEITITQDTASEQ